MFMRNGFQVSNFFPNVYPENSKLTNLKHKTFKELDELEKQLDKEVFKPSSESEGNSSQSSNKNSK